MKDFRVITFGGCWWIERCTANPETLAIGAYPYSQSGICPFCGKHYVENWPGNTFGDEYVDQHCFSCNRDFTVEATDAGRWHVYRGPYKRREGAERRVKKEMAA